jgi:hypothetical protein
MLLELENPFAVHTPEYIQASDVVSLFVPESSEYRKLLHQGHTFLNGPRGAGKSMTLRYMQPDCQMLEAGGCPLNELKFFAAYIPIKATSLALTDLEYLKTQHANVVMNEHFLTTYFASRLFSAFDTIEISDVRGEFSSAMLDYLNGTFLPLLESCGWVSNPSFLPPKEASLKERLRFLRDFCDKIYKDGLLYLRRFAIGGNPIYDGPLCTFLDFLFPLVKELKNLPFMPKGPVYLQVDDAENLNPTQTRILNSWVASRITGVVSFKISTQQDRYKSYRTISNQNIDEPHDFITINISTVYTSAKNRYKQHVYDIVDKRLRLAGLEGVSPSDFLPEDADQEAAIDRIRRELIEKWETDGRGNRARDDALRYARPMYIAGLKGKSKNLPSYSYAGFDQLVHISSGIVRCFLEPLALMYDRQQSEQPGELVKSISPSIQNTIIRSEAQNLIVDGFQRLAAEVKEGGEQDERVRKLYNMINSLGGTFHQILLSDKSERRVFSVMLSEPPDDEVRSVLDLGVQEGLLQYSTKGNKEGTGRTSLYILTRRLAPYFNLDPFGFAGYLSVRNDYLRLAMTDPKHVRRIKDQGLDKFFEVGQMSLFDSDRGTSAPDPSLVP